LAPARSASFTWARCARVVSMMTGKFWSRKNPGRAHNPQDLDAVKHRHVPIKQHHIGIAGPDRFQRSQAVGSFEHRLGAEVRQHRAREPAHISVVIDDQDIKPLKHLFDLRIGHKNRGTRCARLRAI